MKSIKNVLFIFCCFSLFSLSINTYAEPAKHPKVFAYWAGWSNAEIPNMPFDGLFMAFAQLRSSSKNTFYTDYSASGDFHKPSQTGPYSTWNKWSKKHWDNGARAYVSYGGGTNSAFRKYIIDSSDTTISAIAGELKDNIKKYYFDGIELDIESWWEHSANDNKKFAVNFAKLVKTLRQSLDNDPATANKPIIIAVGYNAAGDVPGMEAPGSSYTGSMKTFFQDTNAMSAVYAINIMTYNTGKHNFYSQLTLIDSILDTFVKAGAAKEKLVIGIQPCENMGHPPATPTNVIITLGQHLLQQHAGGLFLWGIGAGGMCKQSAWDYIDAMKVGLGIQ